MWYTRVCRSLPSHTMSTTDRSHDQVKMIRRLSGLMIQDEVQCDTLTPNPSPLDKYRPTTIPVNPPLGHSDVVYNPTLSHRTRTLQAEVKGRGLRNPNDGSKESTPDRSLRRKSPRGVWRGTRPKVKINVGTQEVRAWTRIDGIEGDTGMIE